jgi:hypothetical protein
MQYLIHNCQYIRNNLTLNYDRLTHAYVHWLADVHSGSFASAFTLSFHDSERSRKPPMPIASGSVPISVSVSLRM